MKKLLALITIVLFFALISGFTAKPGAIFKPVSKAIQGPQGPRGLKGDPGEGIGTHAESFNHYLLHAPGSDNQDLSGKVDKVTGKSLVSDTEISKIHASGSDNQDLSSYVLTNDGRLSDARTPVTHAHAASDVTGTAVVTNDARLSDARTPTTHGHAQSDITDLATALSGKEAANSNIQAHVTAAHAPSNAQKNSDITKGEIEAKLTGEIATHTHAGGAGGLGYTLHVQALTSSPADGATVYFGQQPRAPGAVNLSRVYIRKAGTIKMANILCQSGTAGTAEAWSLHIRKNNTTDTLIETVSVSAAERVFDNSALSIAVAAGDYIEIKSVQPTWATNPLTTIYGGYLYIE